MSNWLQKAAGKNWGDFIATINTKRDALRTQAEQICKDQGHIIFPWTCMNSSQCRKCGRTVYLHNIHGQTSGPDVDGRAIKERCDVGFETPYQFSEFRQQDYNGKTVI